MIILLEAYNYDKSRDNIVLKLHPRLAPVKVAVFPIVKKDEDVVKLSRDVFNELKEKFEAVYDDSGSIGRRYARNDEIGTPYCITIDGDSIKGKDVTIRDRDSTKQERIKIKDLSEYLRNKLGL
jgi:glycyl-tRNA synthetase